MRYKRVYWVNQNVMEFYSRPIEGDWTLCDGKQFDDMRPRADFETYEIRCSDESFRTRIGGCVRW